MIVCAHSCKFSVQENCFFPRLQNKNGQSIKRGFIELTFQEQCICNVLSRTRKTVIVDVIVNSVMGLRGWGRVKGVKIKGWGSCCGWGFATMSKTLAFQISRGFLYFFKRFNYRLIVYCVNINEILVCRLKINHAWSVPSSCI